MTSVTTMLLRMQEVDQPQVETSKSVYYAMYRMGECVTTIGLDARELRDDH